MAALEDDAVKLESPDGVERASAAVARLDSDVPMLERVVDAVRIDAALLCRPLSVTELA
jgi:hypothetical protein